MSDMPEVQAAMSRLNAAVRGASGLALSVPVMVSDVRTVMAFSKTLHYQLLDQVIPRPINEYHEDMGPVTWWKIGEAAYIGMPSNSDWTGIHTYFTPHPPIPMEPRNVELQ